MKAGMRLTTDLSLSMGECHRREAVFICMSEIASTVPNDEGGKTH